MAIQIIARSQPNPQKAVAELVENSLDAGAARIVITRARRKGRVFLRVSDDGRGVPPNAEGAPDFDYVATHICDSLKRRLEKRQREGVQGEFGIGLLGFWAIGKSLEMVSQTATAPAWVMTMRSGSRSYDKRRFLGARAGAGVDVTVHDVHREAQSRLTAERLQRYLSEELRERIRRAGATIVIEDRLPPRRTVEVRPAAFEGERISEIESIAVAGRAPIRAELYFSRQEPAAGGTAAGPTSARGGSPGPAEPPPLDEARGVALYRLGTRVCRAITDLPEFARPPWNNRRLQGALDYADFHLAPATREGIVPDAAYHAFVEALRGIEPLLAERLRREDEARAERASRALVRDLQNAFARLLRELPAGHYDWFGQDGRAPFAGGGAGAPGGADAVPGGEGPTAAPDGDGARDEPPLDITSAAALQASLGGAAAEAPPIEDADPAPAQGSLLSGPLQQVRIRPEIVRIAAGRRRRVRALGLDAEGRPVAQALAYSWSLAPAVGRLEVEPGGTAVIEAAPEPARGVLSVRVTETEPADGVGAAAPEGSGPRERSAEAQVLIEHEAPRRAFPPPAYVHAPGQPWRSRWNPEQGMMEVNSAHPDFARVREAAARRRYLGRLYAKELVLHNFGLEKPNAVLERMLEVLTRLDEHL
jgi:hypothetical protein